MNKKGARGWAARKAHPLPRQEYEYPHPTLGEVMTLTEVAAHWGWSRSKVVRDIEAGRLMYRRATEGAGYLILRISAVELYGPPLIDSVKRLYNEEMREQFNV